jgi:hypothetical protein
MWWSLFRRTSGDRPPLAPAEERTGGGSEDEELIYKVADRIVRMRMTVPAIFFLESSKPLAFLGGQLLIFLEPFVQTLFNIRQYQRFALLMENRDNWEKMIRKVEDLEAEYSERERESKKQKDSTKGKKK